MPTCVNQTSLRDGQPRWPGLLSMRAQDSRSSRWYGDALECVTRRRALFPVWAKPSFGADLHALMRAIRPVVRTKIESNTDARKVAAWARRRGLFYCLDKNGFASFARRPSLARRTMTVDRSLETHTAALGHLLGYPKCCCRNAARVGEKGIDALAEEFACRRFIGYFKLTDPTGYLRGSAVLSHVPCSHKCLPSVKMAKALRSRQRIANRSSH